MSERPIGSKPTSPGSEPSSFSGTVRKGMDLDMASRDTNDDDCGNFPCGHHGCVKKRSRDLGERI